VLELVQRTGPVNQTVLALLAVLSVVSWAIILHKSWAYRSAGRHTRTFLDVFRKSSKFSEVQAVCTTIPDSPLVGVFQAGYAEINAQLRLTTAAPAAGHPGAPAPRPTLKSLAAVDRALLRASAVEVNKLEKKVTFLATIASAAPFIGLFGTVWGILDAFQKISTTGATNLSVIGPGISEALVATAAGLFAAIPAVFFYNHFTSTTKALAAEMDDFALEFLNIAERNFT
jgi:biopolymer transport protein TolQ